MPSKDFISFRDTILMKKNWFILNMESPFSSIDENKKVVSLRGFSL
jgi:hypothetical protein